MLRNNTYIRIHIIGDKHSGKSSLLARIADNEIYRDETLESFIASMENTLRRNVLPLEIKKVILEIQNKSVMLRIRNCNETEPLFSYDNNYINPHIVILVCDLTNQKSFENLPTWYEKVRKINSMIPIYLIGTKNDCKHKEVSSLQLVQFNHQYPCERIDLVNSKNGDSVLTAFTEITRSFIWKINLKDAPEETKYFSVLYKF